MPKNSDASDAGDGKTFVRDINDLFGCRLTLLCADFANPLALGGSFEVEGVQNSTDAAIKYVQHDGFHAIEYDGHQTTPSYSY